MSESEFQAQCWICPDCYDDHKPGGECTPRPVTPEEVIAAIEHGDEDHRRWLRDFGTPIVRHAQEQVRQEMYAEIARVAKDIEKQTRRKVVDECYDLVINALSGGTQRVTIAVRDLPRAIVALLDKKE